MYCHPKKRNNHRRYLARLLLVLLCINQILPVCMISQKNEKKNETESIKLQSLKQQENIDDEKKQTKKQAKLTTDVTQPSKETPETESETDKIRISKASIVSGAHINTAKLVDVEPEYTEETEEQSNSESEVIFNEADISEEKSYIDYTEEDVKMLGDLMYAEVGVFLITLDYEEAKRAHMLTGSVVLHRMELGRWGPTMEDVIFSEIAYAERTKELIGNIDTPSEVYEWAEELLRDGPLGPYNLIFQAGFEQGEVYDEIGKEYFCLGNV